MLLKLSELNFVYPNHLVATHPDTHHHRIMYCDENGAVEISRQQWLDKIHPGDVFVVNDSKVAKRRVFTESGLEILFLQDLGDDIWQVLFPARNLNLKAILNLPGGITATLIEKGLPQKLKVDRSLDENYFCAFAELPLPPYIQKARGERHNINADESWYQSQWAQVLGSLAAPTASLHITLDDLNALKQKGVHVKQITLHVGLGTFLPVKVNDLKDHVMHAESVEIPLDTWNAIANAKLEGKKIWALGTTVTRALESAALGYLTKTSKSSIAGETQLLIQPGFEFKIVDRLCTNFHQPHSTLLALVAGFAGLNRTLAAYQWAIDKEFRLFSYGDLSVWKP